MNFFEQEMRQMFGDKGILQNPQFVGKTMLAKLDDDLRVKLQFISGHISNHYDAIQMTIINRTEGVVDKQNFKFSDIIGLYDRPGSKHQDYHMWEYDNNPAWYTPITKEKKSRIADAVLGYVNMYKNE